jgi:hypothetical protein
MSIWGNLYSNTNFYDLLKWTFYAQNIFMDYCTDILWIIAQVFFMIIAQIYF